jgi:hypothetical protein
MGGFLKWKWFMYPAVTICAARLFVSLTGYFPSMEFLLAVRPHRRLRVRFGTSPEETSMTQLLEKALIQVAKLPASEQDAVAAIVIEELASEQRWTDSFAKSQDLLAKLAEKALADHTAGRTKPL